jgi:hypothetical protein
VIVHACHRYAPFTWQGFDSCTHVKTRTLLQICNQVVTRLLSSRYQGVFPHGLFPVVVTSLEPSACYKVDDGNRQFVPTRPASHQLVNNLQTISDLLERLVANLLASSTLSQDDNNLFQTCQQLGTTFTRVYIHPV